jgi:hypothetical protein
MKLYNLVDTKTNDPVFGLERVPETNALFLNLKETEGKNWRNLNVGESTCVKDKTGLIYRMVCVE